VKQEQFLEEWEEVKGDHNDTVKNLAYLMFCRGFDNAVTNIFGEH